MSGSAVADPGACTFDVDEAPTAGGRLGSSSSRNSTCSKEMEGLASSGISPSPVPGVAMVGVVESPPDMVWRGRQGEPAHSLCCVLDAILGPPCLTTNETNYANVPSKHELDLYPPIQAKVAVHLALPVDLV